MTITAVSAPPGLSQPQSGPLAIRGEAGGALLGQHALSLVAIVIMFDQQRLRFLSGVEDRANDNRDSPIILPAEGLRRLAPAAIQQDACRGHTGRRWAGLLADNPGKRLDT